MRTHIVIKSLKKAIFLGVLFFYSVAFSQSISAPTYVFTQICASPSFNNYSVNFNYTGSFGVGNQFILEMSDANGNFIAPTTLVSSGAIVSSPGTLNFAIPITTAGQLYRLRVRSTNPALIGSSSSNFPAYYQAFNQSFYINNQVSTVNICSGGNYTLTIDGATPQDPSPISFPTLKYKWFRNGVQIPGEFSTSIQVNTAGTYRVEIDYGSCSTVSSITKSQDVTVNIVTGGSTFTISSSTGNTTCASIPTILSTQPGYNYQWFKDGVAIALANSYTYSTTQPGTYYVQVNQGGCSSTSNTIKLTSQGITGSLNVAVAPTPNVFTAGDPQTIIVTTNATNPTYQWYFEGSVMAGEINPSLITSVAGTYKVLITQTTGCLLTKEISFILKEGVPATKIPNVVSPNGDGVNDTWNIPQEYLGADTKITIINAFGDIDFETSNYQNNWPVKAIDFTAVNPIFYYVISKEGGKEQKGTITVIK